MYEARYFFPRSRYPTASESGPLRSLCVKFKIKVALYLCYNKVTLVTSRCDLQVALKHHKAIQILISSLEAGQPLGHDMIKTGLNALVSKLQMDDETNIIESTGDWTSAL